MASDTSEMQRKAKATMAGFKRPALWVLVFSWSLAVCTGLGNTVALRTWGLYVSHMTGATSAIGMGIEGVQQGRQGLHSLTGPLCLVASFLLGAFACGVLIDKNQVHFGGKAFYGVALIGDALLLVLAVALSPHLSAACCAAAAFGLQNAMCTSHFGAVVRTTHVTGTLTDIGSTLGRLAMILLRKGCRGSRLNVLERAEAGVDARKLLVLLPMWLSFLLGCTIGAYLDSCMGIHALLVPAAFTFTVGAMYLLFRQQLKEHLKALEKERLSGDLDDVQKTLARAHEYLHAVRSNANGAPEGSSAQQEMVIELDQELGQMLETIHEVGASIEDLCEHVQRNASRAATSLA